MEKVVIYGAGNRLKLSVTALDYTYDIVSIVDASKEKQGKNFCFVDYKGIQKKYLIESFNKDNNNVLYIITCNDWIPIYKKLKYNGVKNIKLLNGVIDKTKESKDLSKYIIADLNDYKINLQYNIYYDVWENWDNHFMQPYILRNLIEISKDNNIDILRNKEISILDYGFGCGSLNLNLLMNGYNNVCWSGSR